MSSEEGAVSFFLVQVAFELGTRNRMPLSSHVFAETRHDTLWIHGCSTDAKPQIEQISTLCRAGKGAQLGSEQFVEFERRDLGARNTTGSSPLFGDGRTPGSRNVPEY